jgi:hypothetical protein
VRDLKIPPGPRFQITKHLNLAILAQGTKCSGGCFEFLGFEGGIGIPTHGGPHYSTAAPVSNHQTSNFNHSDSRSQYFW